MPHPRTQRARALRNNPTDAERHLWRYLRRRQLEGHPFRRQYPIGVYIVDFVCLEQQLVVELDGGQHAQRVGYDRSRDHFIGQAGFRVLRYWNDQVLRETEAVLADILRHLSPP